ncbi:MAG: hypothetical protein Q8Q28_09760 [Pseudomonadota bacterium]|nr:hypothetical protein [Pseudomonadota bacterium]
MSPSWGSSILYIGPDRVVLRARGAVHTAATTEPGWAGALVALQSLLDGRRLRRRLGKAERAQQPAAMLGTLRFAQPTAPPSGRVAVVLSSHFAPLWLLPGAPTRLNHEETRGWVESQAAERFGDLAANWRLAFRPAPAGEPILASGIDAGHWAELLHTLTAAGLSVASVVSWPALALARYGKSGGRGSARLILAEAGRLTLASLVSGELAALDSVRGEPDALTGLLARAALVDGLGDAPLLLVGSGVAGDWAGAVLANSPEAAVLSGRAEPDFLQTRPRPPLVAWLLLAAGLGLAALAGTRYATLTEQLATLTVAETPVAAKPRPERGIVATPARPWGELLNRLESQRPKQIALLSLRGDAARGDARITAEARSAADMLAWFDSLRAAGFGDASLVQHEVQLEAEQQPVRFEIRLDWGTP